MERHPSMNLHSLTLDPLLEPEPKTLTKEQLEFMTRAAAMITNMQHQNKLPGMKTLEEKHEKSNKPGSEADVCQEKGTHDDEDPQPK